MSLEDGANPILNSPIMGYAHHRIILDDAGRPYDYEFLEVNRTFEKLTGLSKEKILHRTVREVLPGIENGEFDWIGFYGDVALNGGQQECEQYSEPLGRWYRVQVYSTVETYFTTMIVDTTDRKTAEQTLLCLVDAATELQSCTPETVDYTGIAETARYLSGAFCTALNLFDADGRNFTTAAVAGIPDGIRKATDILGFSLAGRRWRHDPVREAALGDNRTTVFPSLGSLSSGGIASSLTDRIARTFDLGEVVVTRIITPNGTLGDFTLLFHRATHLMHKDLLELFSGMVGVTLVRIRTEEQNARLVREKETLLKEVHHRIKNNMNTMTSLLSLQAHQVRGTRVAEEVLNDVRSRFRSMEILYDRLYRSDEYDVGSVAEYLQILVPQVVALFPAGARVAVTVAADAGSRCIADAEASKSSAGCILDAKRLSTVGLIMNELVTNAMKYAFPEDTPTDGAGTAPATLMVTTACRDETIEIHVKDNGPGLPDSFDPDNPSGFGTTMVQAMVTQLDGTIQYESSQEPHSHGTRIVLAFPRGNKRVRGSV